MWTLSDNTQREIIREIEGELKRHADRSAGLVAGAFVEKRLEEAIKASLVRNTKSEGVLFKGAGPLATFSAKIEIGLLLGLYDEGTKEILHTIRRIRNEFAHTLGRQTFKSQKIRDLCNNLAPVRENKFPQLPKDISENPERRANMSESDFRNLIFGGIFNITDSPQNRFVATAKALLFLLKLSEVLSERRMKNHPPPVSPGSLKKFVSRDLRKNLSGSRRRKKPSLRTRSSPA